MVCIQLMKNKQKLKYDDAYKIDIERKGQNIEIIVYSYCMDDIFNSIN